MSTIKRLGAVGKRALKQLGKDHRLIGLSIMFPLIIIYFIKVIFDVLASPFFDITVYVIPYGAFIVHFITFILTAIVLVRERTSGTLSRMFVSGYNPIEIIGGYFVSYTGLASIQSLLELTELNFLFELNYDFGQLASFYLAMWLLAVISLALGTLVSNFVRNEGQVFPFIPVILLSLILSGILLPVEQLPDWVQVLAYFTPLFYTNEVLQNLIGGNALNNEWPMLIGLFLYGAAVMLMAIFTLREKD